MFRLDCPMVEIDVNSHIGIEDQISLITRPYPATLIYFFILDQNWTWQWHVEAEIPTSDTGRH